MKALFRSLSAAAVVAALVFAAPAPAADSAPAAGETAMPVSPPPPVPPPPVDKPVAPPKAEKSFVDLVICLDTSGSMNGLIDSARVKLWAIVNELAKARPAPEIRVALFQYGNQGIKAEGWVRKEVGFTNDLDEVYGKLNALRTNGGNEFVARVAREAVTTLDWSKEKNALKLIFIAGNESANQDKKFTVDEVFKDAISKGIQINTIFCGSPTHGDAGGWQAAAKLADGEFSCIDQAKGTIAIATPADARLAELSSRLNSTYVAYGKQGENKQKAQVAADSAAGAAAPSAAAERAEAKAGRAYNASAWDLVDAKERGDLDLSKVKEEELPEEMRKLDAKGREEYVARKADERKQIQEEIQKLSKERAEYIKTETAKKGGSGDKAFDEAVRATIRTQAAKKGIEIKE